MENLLANHTRKWISILTIFTGFSIQTGLSFGYQPITSAQNMLASGVDPLTFIFGCIDGNPGDTICIPVTVENFIDINIIQLEIYWNSSVLDFYEIRNPGSSNINVNADFNLSGPNALKFIPLGFPIDGESLPDGTVLFEICFRIIGFPDSTSCVGISPYFDFEAGNADGEIPVDSINCCMMVDEADNLVGFLTSCGPALVGGNGEIDVTVYGGNAPYTITWVETGSGSTGGPVIIPIEGGSSTLNVPEGNYDILITDGSGSTVTYMTNVSTVALDVMTRLRHPTCYKFDNGTMWIKPLGGQEPFSYIWQSLEVANLAGSGFIRFLGDSSLVTSLPDGMYSVLVRDNNGCEMELTITLDDNPFVIDVGFLNDATCPGAVDGMIELNISGATPIGISDYILEGNLTGTPFQITTNMIVLGNLGPGDYSITISDNVPQCDTVFEFTIGYTDTITANLTVTDPPCAGGGNGSLSIRGLTNGVSGPSYSYTIFDRVSANMVTTVCCIGGIFNYSPLPPGEYAVLVQEGPCISDSIIFSISEPPPMVITLDGLTPDNCIQAQNTGDVWFNITNGTGPYILDVGVGFQDGDTIFNIGRGNYTLTVEDNNGCTMEFDFFMPDGSDNEDADISFQIDGTPCDGGTLTVLYQGGPVPPGTGISWSHTGSIASTIPITDSDTISVQLFLNQPIFCILDDTVHINCMERLELDITIEQPLCGVGASGGPYTGTVIVDTSNATAPVTWIWSFPDTTTTGIYSGLTPGKYYVTVTDALDSVAVDSFEIVAPNTLNLTFSNIDSTSCPEICDGGVRIIASNGDPAADYQLYWDPINPMADTGIIFNITDLCAGLTVFNVSQDGVCFYPDTIEIFAPEPMTISLVQSEDVTCYGFDDGLLEVSTSGGSPGYTYDWLAGSNDALNANLTAGWHYVTITDSEGCIQSDSFSITEPDTLIADIDTAATLNLSCGGSADGTISLTITGGNTGGYAYNWNPNVSTTYQAVNLPAGNYLITVSDPKGCSDTASYLLTSPPPIVVTWPVVEMPQCFGDETVLMIEQVSGGNGNYSFTINSGELNDIDETIFLPSGIYIVSVFDDRGCSSDTTYIIMEPDPILVSIGPDDPVVDLGDSLLISGTVDQGDLPIVMTQWTSAEPLSCDTCVETWVYNSVPALYTWTVTDENGCQGSASILVDVDYERDVYIPNVFSPNADGRNDDFRIYTGPGVVSINYIHIYDRWGNLVHVETDLLPNPDGAGNWDGSFKGEKLNPGVYVYVTEVTFVDNNTTLEYRGDITLLK